MALFIPVAQIYSKIYRSLLPCRKILPQVNGMAPTFKQAREYAWLNLFNPPFPKDSLFITNKFDYRRYNGEKCFCVNTKLNKTSDNRLRSGISVSLICGSASCIGLVIESTQNWRNYEFGISSYRNRRLTYTRFIFGLLLEVAFSYMHSILFRFRFGIRTVHCYSFSSLHSPFRSNFLWIESEINAINSNRKTKANMHNTTFTVKI